MGRFAHRTLTRRRNTPPFTFSHFTNSYRSVFHNPYKVSANTSLQRYGWRTFRKKDEEQSALSVIQTLIVSTATRVGMGNLVGVVAAISAGGAGAVFWMWVTALIGSSTAFIEATLSQIYKEKDPLYGGYRGGPAYYIHRYFEEKSGKKKRYVLLSVLFAISGLICWCGISQVVSNSVASAFKNAFHIPPIYTTVILVILAAIIVLRKMQL